MVGDEALFKYLICCKCCNCKFVTPVETDINLINEIHPKLLLIIINFLWGTLYETLKNVYSEIKLEIIAMKTVLMKSYIVFTISYFMDGNIYKSYVRRKISSTILYLSCRVIFNYSGMCVFIVRSSCVMLWTNYSNTRNKIEISELSRTDKYFINTERKQFFYVKDVE